MRYAACVFLTTVLLAAPGEAHKREACPATGRPEAGAGWQKISPGLEVRDISIRFRQQERARMAGIRLDPKAFRVALRWETSGPAPAATAEGVARRTGAAVVVNAGFFDEKGRPMGFFQAGGVTYNSRVLHRGRRGALHMGAVFFVRRRSRKVAFTQRDAFRPAQAREAFQAGPLLVRKSRPVEGLKEYREYHRPARRSVLALGRRRRFLILVSEEVGRGISWCELQEFLVLPEKRGGLGVVDAMNLDGGSSAQLFVQSGSYRRAVSGRAVPAFISWLRRAPSKKR